MKDSIVEEVRKIRDEHAARFDYDIDAVFEDLKKHEKKSGESVITLAPKRVVKHGKGFQLEISPADVSKAADMEQLAQRTRAQFGGIDILVYAAGTNTPDRAMNRLNPGIWDMMVNVNLSGAYYVTQAALPPMRERKSG